MLNIALLASALIAWPQPTVEMKPWAYNWWMGSAVDAQGLEYQCSEMADKGFGGFHVIPIYGAKGYETQYRKLLSPEWIDAWNMAVRTARQHGLGVDLTMGAGWCFGGPWVTKEDAASSLMKVKRAGPGGQGYMIDPFSPVAMSNHVAQFEAAFGKNGTAERPRAFYHDSYEYFNAKPKKDGDVDELIINTFSVWSNWCRENGYLTRNEAHGGPANWLDFYAVADIPETEMFGKKDRDILLCKFASSAAHAKGTKLVSAESCTWVDEHFMERPVEIKEVIDRLFLSGVNHVFYHGLCYSPKDIQWPGWCFYASLEMNPRNPIWREVASLNMYITRCQSIFQTWQSDNDLAIIYDPTSFRAKPGNKYKHLAVHDKSWFYSQAIGPLARRLYDEGYCFDYISPRMLAKGYASRYSEVINPEEGTLPQKAKPTPFNSKSGLLTTRWKKDGRILYFLVNVSSKAIEVKADEAFCVMNPLNGSISAPKSCIIEPKHSLFVADAKNICAVPAKIINQKLPLTCGTWVVEPIIGGPNLPEKKELQNPELWSTWDEAFSGTMRYSTTFNMPTVNSTNIQLDLGTVREIARVKINGHDLGVKFMPPYRFNIDSSILKNSDNKLEIEVTSLGANRLRWNDINGVKWKIFNDINMVGMNYLPLNASKYKVYPSGLAGPISLIIW